MPLVKNKTQRLGLIDRFISSSVYYDKEMMKKQIEEIMDIGYISMSQIEKDIWTMKDMYDAPIKHSKKKGYYYTEPYDFSLKFLELWSRYINFDKHLKRKLYE